MFHALPHDFLLLNTQASVYPKQFQATVLLAVCHWSKCECSTLIEKSLMSTEYSSENSKGRDHLGGTGGLDSTVSG